jgi:hypothetical protein
MADEHTTPEAEVVEAWLAGELEGDLLSYVIVDAQTWTRNLAARLRACGYRLSDEAFRALRKRVDNYAESRLAWLREDAHERARANFETASAYVGPAILHSALTHSSTRLGLHLRGALAAWTKDVLESLENHCSDLTPESRHAIARLVAARATCCWLWALEARSWEQHQAEIARVADRATRPRQET